MEKGFYHPDRGYWQTLSEPSDEIRATYPSGTKEVSLQPSPLHKYSGTKWVAPTQQEKYDYEAGVVRSERDWKLKYKIDPVVTNPLRWGSMSAEEQQLWADYRQALLDIPEQEGFPFTVVWPTEPA